MNEPTPFRDDMAVGNHRVAKRKALLWLGNSDRDVIKLYNHLSDAQSAAAMESLATPERQPVIAVITPVVEVKPDVMGSSSPETADALGSLLRENRGHRASQESKL